MLFTVSDLNVVYAKAYQCLYRVREKALQEQLTYGETALSKEADIIYDLMKAVEWASANTSIPDTDYGYQNLISYFRHKVDGFSFRDSAGVSGSYSQVTDVSKPPVVVVTGAWRLYIQLIVGVTPQAPVDGGLAYTDINLIGGDIQVYLDGTELGVNIPDRQSYIFNTLTGTITFNAPLAHNQLIRIYVLVK